MEEVQKLLGHVNELIETLWNVNLTGNSTLSLPFSELIETLWNVNLIKSQTTNTQNVN